MDKFCYLGDMLSVNGDADAAVGARIQIQAVGSVAYQYKYIIDNEKREGDCTTVVCKVVCCMEVRPNL